MDLSAIDLYSTTPAPEALPGMRVVSYAGTQHLQCPVQAMDPAWSLDDWIAYASPLGQGFAGGARYQKEATLYQWADQLDVKRVLRGLRGPTGGAATLQSPLKNAVGADTLDVYPSAFHPLENQLAIVGLLLAQGARPDLLVLNDAVGNPNPAVLRRLLELAPTGGWDFTGTTARERGTPLHAMQSHHWSTAANTVDLLLAAGVPIDQTVDDGMTALAFAVKGKAWGVVRRLLERGADPEKALNGIAPLHWAAHGDDPRSIALLLAAGANPSPRMVNGNTPMNEAARRASALALQDFLDRGFDPLADQDAAHPDGRSLALARDAASGTRTVVVNGAVMQVRNPMGPTSACVSMLEAWILRHEAAPLIDAEPFVRRRL